MEALLISDIQGDPGSLSYVRDYVAGRVQLEELYVFCAGDLNNRNKRMPEESQYSGIYGYFESMAKSFFVIDGNHDNAGLMKRVFGKGYTEARNVGNFTFLAHNNVRPGDLKDFMSQRRDEADLRRFYRKKIDDSARYFMAEVSTHPKIDIFLMHIPPYTGYVEGIATENRISSMPSFEQMGFYLTDKTVQLLEKTNPLLFFSGHRTDAFFGEYAGTYFMAPGTFNDGLGDTGSFMLLDVDFEERAVDACELYGINHESGEVWRIKQ